MKTYSSFEVADICGVSRIRARKLAKWLGLPKNGRGHYVWTDADIETLEKRKKPHKKRKNAGTAVAQDHQI